MGRNALGTPALLSECWWAVMAGEEAKSVPLPTVDVSKTRLAEAHGVLENGCKDRLKITCRSAD
jgi:hypothetical protein